MKTLCTAAALAFGETALAAQGTDATGIGLLGLLFLVLCCVVGAFQLLPALTLLATMVRELVSGVGAAKEEPSADPTGRR